MRLTNTTGRDPGVQATKQCQHPAERWAQRPWLRSTLVVDSPENKLQPTLGESGDARAISETRFGDLPQEEIS
jgi:hypothetical protein